MAFLILTILIVLFALLAIWDGFYLHIVKYRLFNHEESRFEHLMHTFRAILFPVIVYFLFLTQNNLVFFCIGLMAVAANITVLAVDAYAEKDSRVFMGGLPRWEYIIHLFVNGFHFASIALFLSIKLNITELGLEVIPSLESVSNSAMFELVAWNLLPGAVLLAIVHILTCRKKGIDLWNRFFSR